MDKKLSTDVCLAYSNRTEQEIAFKRELDSWRQANPNIKISYVVTECEPKDKTCIFGRIDSAFIKKSICDIEERMVFIYGPPKMVEAMKEIAVGLKVAPENLKTEVFVGY
jgi:ferredoxin-NADP reductase